MTAEAVSVPQLLATLRLAQEVSVLGKSLYLQGRLPVEEALEDVDQLEHLRGDGTEAGRDSRQGKVILYYSGRVYDRYSYNGGEEYSAALVVTEATYERLLQATLQGIPF